MDIEREMSRNRKNWSHQLKHEQFPKGTERGVRKAKRSLLACHTRCKCSIETTRNSMNVKLGINVIKLLKRLIGMEVTIIDRGLECHLKFMTRRLA